MLHSERELGELHEREYTRVSGNATTGLVLALKSLGIQNKKIAIPDAVCFQVAVAVILSGNHPFFIDINLKDFGPSIAHLEEHINEIGAVIAVHNFGMMCDIEAIENLCKEHHVPLIEDLAVAQGAHLASGKKAGSFGDVSVVSFGAGKIIDIDHGGAIMTNNSDLFQEICELDEKLGPLNSSMKEEIDRIGSFHTKVYNELYISSLLPEKANVFLDYASKGWSAFIARKSEDFSEDRLMKSLKGLSDNLEKRRSNYHEIERKFEDSEEIKMMHFPEGSAIWRAGLFIHNRDKVLRELLNKGIRISSWHPPAHQFFGFDLRGNQSSIEVGDRILNIWVNEDFSSEYLNQIISVIQKNM